MMHPPDLYSRTGMSTSLHFALSLGLRSLLDLHHTEEQLSSTDSFAQANSCATRAAPTHYAARQASSGRPAGGRH